MSALTRLRNSPLLRGTATLASGNFGAQLIALLATPFIARLFDPSDFGVMALVVSIGTLVSAIAGLRYERAISLPKTDTEARSLARLAGSSVVAFVLVAVITILLLAAITGNTAWTGKLGAWVWAIPCVVLFAGFAQTLDGWLVRTKGFRYMARSDIAMASVTSGVRLTVGGLFGSSVWGLVIGYLSGILSKVVVSLSGSRSLFLKSETDRQQGDLRSIARRYRDFPFFNLPASFSRKLSLELPVLLLGIFFAPAVAGFYAIANRLFHRSVVTVTTSMQRVYLQRAAEYRNQSHRMTPLFVQATLFISLIAAGPLLAVMMFGTEISVWLLGEKWARAGLFLEIMAPWLISMTMVPPTGATMVVLRRQRLWFRLQLVALASRAAVLGTAIWLDATPERALASFVVASVLVNLITVVIGYRLVATYDSSLDAGSEK